MNLKGNARNVFFFHDAKNNVLHGKGQTTFEHATEKKCHNNSELGQTWILSDHKVLSKLQVRVTSTSILEEETNLNVHR